MQRAVNTEAKAGQRSSTMVRDSGAHCSKDHHPSHITSSKEQIQSSKDFSRSEESKPKDLKPAPSNNATEPAKKKDKKEKKKRSQGQRQERTGEKAEQSLAIGVNTKVPKKKIKAKYFNYNKKGHFANECTKPPKN